MIEPVSRIAFVSFRWWLADLRTCSTMTTIPSTKARAVQPSVQHFNHAPKKKGPKFFAPRAPVRRADVERCGTKPEFQSAFFPLLFPLFFSFVQLGDWTRASRLEKRDLPLNHWATPAGRMKTFVSDGHCCKKDWSYKEKIEGTRSSGKPLAQTRNSPRPERWELRLQ